MVRAMSFFQYELKLMSMTLHGLMHICLVGAPHQMISIFKIFQDIRELENFPMGQKK